MGLFDKIKNSVTGGSNDTANLQSEIESKGFQISSCSNECDSCNSKFPSSLKFDDDFPLWNSTKPYGLHIVVATGKHDWPHDACGVSNTLSNQVSNWASSSNKENALNLENSESIKVTVGSLCSPEYDTNEDYINEQTGDLLLLPYFIWIRNISIPQVNSFMNDFIPFLTKKIENPLSFKHLQFPNIRVEIDQNQSHIFLCSHRTRDKRCGITAPIMKKELDLYLREVGLYRDYGDDRLNGVKVSFINHIGGHKYAANLIIYSKSGKNIWLARCKPNNCKPIIDECILNDGNIWPENTRIIQKFNPIDW